MAVTGTFHVTAKFGLGHVPHGSSDASPCRSQAKALNCEPEKWGQTVSKTRFPKQNGITQKAGKSHIPQPDRQLCSQIWFRLGLCALQRSDLIQKAPRQSPKTQPNLKGDAEPMTTECGPGG